MPTTRGRQVRISCPNPQPVQIDGDVLGTAVSLTLTVDAGALLVRCAPSTSVPGHPELEGRATSHGLAA
jgi:diacylglycerol kinase family enzyme